MTVEAMTVASPAAALAQAKKYPHLRYMGSKYRLLPALAEVFADTTGDTAIDPFSGSGVVSYLLKAQGFSVTSRDYLKFPGVLTRATCANQTHRISDEQVARIVHGPNLDGRDFIARTYKDRFFTADDLKFLDAAWSQIAAMTGPHRDLAIAALILAAARKQPRGVFTVTGLRYDDGRASLHKPLADQFVDCVQAWNDAVVSGPPCHVEHGDVSTATSGADLVYLDPPYAPPRDDNDYIKRYWFLEGLADYWDGGTAEVMANTLTKKLPKRPTLFGSKRTIHTALTDTLDKFRSSTIVLSYGSNAVPPLDTLVGMMTDITGTEVDVINVPHRYHFGTHKAAARREAVEYLLVARQR